MEAGEGSFRVESRADVHRCREETPLEEMPATLQAAMAMEPIWLRLWIWVLIATNLAALAFVVRRAEGRLRVRGEPLAIVAGFAAAGVFMSWLYGQVGYVRLLGLAHLVFWTPPFVWVLARRRAIGTGSPFGKYAHAYLVVAGISLAIDAIDLIRYVAGDRGSQLG